MGSEGDASGSAPGDPDADQGTQAPAPSGGRVRSRTAVPFPGVTPATRAVMRGNRSRDTGPEVAVRRLAHAMGYRFRLHRKDLPGRPDLVFGPRRKVVFVHGCFWHAHGCKDRRPPKTRSAFWADKFDANVARDARVEAALVASGWSVLILWECEVRDRGSTAATLARFLGPPGRPPLVGPDAQGGG